jgi:hypothetical protein
MNGGLTRRSDSHPYLRVVPPAFRGTAMLEKTEMKTKIAIALIALPLLAAPSFASERGRGEPAVAPKLSVAEVETRVREGGYTSVQSIKLKRDGNYKVKAVDANSRRVGLRVDGNTGAFSARR